MKKIAVLLGLLGLLATGSAMAVSSGWSDYTTDGHPSTTLRQYAIYNPPRSENFSSSSRGAVDGSACPSPTTTQPVPEPATLLLFGSGLIAISLIRRRQKNPPPGKGKMDRFIF